MSNIIESLEKVGVKPGTKVEGLFTQTLKTVYENMFDEAETISSIEPHPDDEDLAIIKTKEMNERATIYTSEGEKEVPEENRQYVVSGVDLLKIMDPNIDTSSFKAIADDEEAEQLDLVVSKEVVETDFSTLPTEFIKALTPFMNYIKANSEDLDDILDVESIFLSVDGVKYDLNTLIDINKTID